MTAMTISPEHPAPQLRDRVAALADIRRAASLEDIRFEVSVAHTNRRLTARFCVSLRRARRSPWAFGVEIKDAKDFASQLTQLAKAHTSSKCSCHVAAPAITEPQSAHSHRKHGSSCAMCVQLRTELKRWPKFPAFSTVGKRHLDAKCVLLAQFFARVFRVLARNAAWLPSCALLREMLRRTETLCRLQYDDEDDAAVLSAIKSLKRVAPPTDDHDPLANQSNDNNNDDDDGKDNGESDCSICLGSLFEPVETATATADALGEHDPSTSSQPPPTTRSQPQPSQGVELPCGHRFHDSCVCLWFHTRVNCPVCRQAPTVQE